MKRTLNARLVVLCLAGLIALVGVALAIRPTEDPDEANLRRAAFVCRSLGDTSQRCPHFVVDAMSEGDSR
jgi:hypothetical protein